TAEGPMDQDHWNTVRSIRFRQIDVRFYSLPAGKELGHIKLPDKIFIQGLGKRRSQICFQRNGFSGYLDCGSIKGRVDLQRGTERSGPPLLEIPGDPQKNRGGIIWGGGRTLPAIYHNQRSTESGLAITNRKTLHNELIGGKKSFCPGQIIRKCMGIERNLHLP